MSIIRDNDRNRRTRTDVDFSVTPACPLDDVKAYLEIPLSDTSQDALLTSMIATASMWTQRFTWRYLVAQTVVMTLDHFPGQGPVKRLASRGINPGVGHDVAIVCPGSPISSVTKIEYFLSDGTAVEIDSSEYRLDASSDNWAARICLTESGHWPTDRLRDCGGVEITLAAGYGGSLYPTLPPGICEAIKRIVAHQYFNRGDCTDCGSCAKECGAAMMLANYTLSEM